MQIDNTTLADLAIFTHSDEPSVFRQLDFTRTSVGHERLSQLFAHPFGDLQKIRDTQAILRLALAHETRWASPISNGTVMVIERFYETPLDDIPSGRDPVTAMLYKIMHKPDYSLVRYSIGHFADFFRGLAQLVSLREEEGAPAMMTAQLGRLAQLLERPALAALAARKPGLPFTPAEVVGFGGYLRNGFRPVAQEMIAIYGLFDAWYSMAFAGRKFQLALPEFVESEEPVYEATQLYHLLLNDPVPYDLLLDNRHHFLFLTGANMAGKSTFIKSVGIALFLAHLGMGVPAASMRLSLFDGIISNINVVDNIVRGESYFYNEVQRVKNTILTINNNRKWLVLIDELFKGTNVEDAMKCSSVVVRGLVRIARSLFILSTHLYEIAAELRASGSISFRYFETAVEGEKLLFNYQLREGVSNDRIGYLILKNEKVVEMLESL